MKLFEQQLEREMGKLAEAMGPRWEPADEQIYRIAWEAALHAARDELLRAESVEALTEGSLSWLRKGTSLDIHDLAVREVSLRERNR